jgi:hypothetical protein
MNWNQFVKYLPILKEAGMIAFQMIKLRMAKIRYGPVMRIQEASKLIRKEVKKFTLLDAEYHLVPKSDIGILFNVNLAKFLKYRKEAFDCDDFARTAGVLIRLAFGNVAVGDAIIKYKNGSRHMFNVVVTTDKKLIYVEPQTNKIVEKNFKVEEIRL